jgi:collagenase-like PrtC family protease
MLLNGYTLAYPSEKYPQLRDPYALNVKSNFIEELIPYAHRHGVRIFLTMTTDDHAEGFGKLYPEAVRINRHG